MHKSAFIIKPLLVASGLYVSAMLLVSGCSVQQQTNKAEDRWLQAKTLQTAVHREDLTPEFVQSSTNNFVNASAAVTHLTGKIQPNSIRELSGLAPVHGVDDAYWAINDSGNRSELFAISSTGKQLAKVSLPIFNRDWEDLASFEVNGKAWLVIAETGDNLFRHAKSTLYFFKQPDLNNPPRSIKLHHQIDFSYQDGPQNVESMAVSVDEQKVYLISKNTKAPNIYTLPLALKQANSSLVATRAGQLAKLQATSDVKWWEKLVAQRILMAPTAIDFSPDGRFAVVANYRHVYLFKRQSSETWSQALAKKPQVLTSHRLEQSESVAIGLGSDKVVLSSEGVNAPILTVVPE